VIGSIEFDCVFGREKKIGKIAIFEKKERKKKRKFAQKSASL